MFKSMFRAIIFILTILLLKSCAVGDLTDLWPAGSEDNEEVVIREIPGESFDPEDTEEISIIDESESENGIS